MIAFSQRTSFPTLSLVADLGSLPCTSRVSPPDFLTSHRFSPTSRAAIAIQCRAAYFFRSPITAFHCFSHTTHMHPARLSQEQRRALSEETSSSCSSILTMPSTRRARGLHRALSGPRFWTSEISRKRLSPAKSTMTPKNFSTRLTGERGKVGNAL